MEHQSFSDWRARELATCDMELSRGNILGESWPESGKKVDPRRRCGLLLLSENYKRSTRKLQENYKKTTRTLQENYKKTTKFLVVFL